MFTQRELFWLDDILPGKNAAIKKKQMLKEEQELIVSKKQNKHNHHQQMKNINETVSGDDEANYFHVSGRSMSDDGAKGKIETKTNVRWTKLINK